MDKDTDIEELRRGKRKEEDHTVLTFARPEKETSSNSYVAFRADRTGSPQTRLTIYCSRSFKKLIPRYDLLYNIVCNWGQNFICLIYPFMRVKIYGRNLGDLEIALTDHVATLIKEYYPLHTSDFAPGEDDGTLPCITEIVIEGHDDEIDADKERDEYLLRQHQAEEEERE